ncbi:MAG: toprim domain-containing protein [Rhodobacteraceae bacterium]|nr:toprim domain-containing protein [Paracoccaceae bacterium]
MSEARALTLALSGDWRGNHGSAPCPLCQPERRRDQRALSIREEAGRLLTFCHKSGCDFRSVMEAAGLPAATGAIDLQAARDANTRRAAHEAEQREKARKLWEVGRPIIGTKGEAYLRGRGITCTLPPSLRWVADAYHGPSARWHSCMVADVSTGGVHRTFFEKSGTRLAQHAKMMQGPCAGGAVALSEAQGPLVVCEGIETGLSLLSGLLGEPAEVWAALSTSGIRALSLPTQPRRLIVAADGDAPGIEAAKALGDRAYYQGWEVYLWPAPEGQDWNDVLQSRGAA